MAGDHPSDQFEYLFDPIAGDTTTTEDSVASRRRPNRPLAVGVGRCWFWPPRPSQERSSG